MLLEADGPSPVFAPIVTLIVSFTEPAGTGKGDCTSNDDCAAGEYCERSVGMCDAVGVCAPRPEACIDVWMPVCGCNELTYSNACDAAVAGVSVVGDTACVVPL